LKYRINQSWRKRVTGGRKACPSGRGKAPHAKLVRKLKDGMIYGYLWFCIDEFKVMLNFDVRDHFCRASGCLRGGQLKPECLRGGAFWSQHGLAAKGVWMSWHLS